MPAMTGPVGITSRHSAARHGTSELPADPSRSQRFAKLEPRATEPRETVTELVQQAQNQDYSLNITYYHSYKASWFLSHSRS